MALITDYLPLSRRRLPAFVVEFNKAIVLLLYGADHVCAWLIACVCVCVCVRVCPRARVSVCVCLCVLECLCVFGGGVCEIRHHMRV
jgi:hypothetical protein